MRVFERCGFGPHGQTVRGDGGTIDPHTATGLVDCYVRAIPYFRNTLISMAVFLPLLFSRVSLTQAAPTRRLAAQGV